MASSYLGDHCRKAGLTLPTPHPCPAGSHLGVLGAILSWVPTPPALSSTGSCRQSLSSPACPRQRRETQPPRDSPAASPPPACCKSLQASNAALPRTSHPAAQAVAFCRVTIKQAAARPPRATPKCSIRTPHLCLHGGGSCISQRQPPLIEAYLRSLLQFCALVYIQAFPTAFLHGPAAFPSPLNDAFL